MTDNPLYGLEGQRAILVASTGGHLSQLIRVRNQIDIADNPLWVTFDHPQSRSLLAGERVAFLPYIAPRDLMGVLRSLRRARKIIREEDFDCMISTGAAIALSMIPQAWIRGRRTLYIESVARLKGPSLTGKLIAALPGVELATQHQSWAGGRWKYHGSVLDGYEIVRLDEKLSPRMRVFVTLGTIKPYRFDALVDATLAALPAEAEVVWQLGTTGRTDLPGTSLETVDALRFDELIEWADVIVTHAGVGTILRVLEMGKLPVVFDRDPRRNEHVDGHQQEIRDFLKVSGLAVTPTLDEFRTHDLERARLSTVKVANR